MKPRSKLSRCCSGFFTGIKGLAAATTSVAGVALTTLGTSKLIHGEHTKEIADIVLKEELTFHNLSIPLGNDPFVVPYMKMILGEGLTQRLKNYAYALPEAIDEYEPGAVFALGIYLFIQGVAQTTSLVEVWKLRKAIEQQDAEIPTVAIAARTPESVPLATIHIQKSEPDAEPGSSATAYTRLP